MSSRSGDRVDLLAAGLGHQPVREQSAPEVSEDAMLVRAAREGDRAAFGRLYQRYARMVHGILLAKVPLADVDDIVQDVFLRALRRLSTLRESGSFGAWLAAIARNLANDYYRRSVPEDTLADDPTDNDIDRGSIRHEARPSQPGCDQEPARHQSGDIDPEAGRRHDRPEIAERTGLTQGSVRVNLHRGMQQLRAKLDPAPPKIRTNRRRCNHGYGE